MLLLDSLLVRHVSLLLNLVILLNDCVEEHVVKLLDIAVILAISMLAAPRVIRDTMLQVVRVRVAHWVEDLVSQDYFLARRVFFFNILVVVEASGRFPWMTDGLVCPVLNGFELSLQVCIVRE